MARDPRYDILFESVKIGPVTSRNRFYQVPHCDAHGHNMPHGDAAHRRTKAEGGWGVICTEQCSIHPTSDGAPYGETRIWDDGHARQLSLLVDAVHEHGALAGIELAHNGPALPNRMSREVPIGPSSMPVHYNWDPITARAMDLEDIRDLRRWQADAAKRAASVGFDIVYVYAGHGLGMGQFFLSRHTNHRTDEYGGSLENRARLIGEMLEDTLEAVGQTCGVAFRFSVDEMIGAEGITWQDEGQAVVEMYAELPHLWDVNISDWKWDSGVSRYFDEGWQEPYIAFVKQKTTKPVVGVGRFTSPDTMVDQINRGIVDIIGAARPSIADPFLPTKIYEGRNEDIRECIGCNICVASETTVGRFRCTQNPTAGEEYRRGWHPEKIDPKPEGNEDGVLVIGAGPAGLEAARALGMRGYDVHLVEARVEVGGRVIKEARLPGLAAWGRVASYRDIQIGKLKNVEVHLNTELSAKDVLEYGAEVVVVATGSTWRQDGCSHTNTHAIPGSDGENVFTPDAVMAGAEVKGPVVVFDDDHYYMAAVIAEKLRKEGNEVTFVTPLMELARWGENTLEFEFTMERIHGLGIEVITDHNITNIGGNGVDIVHLYADKGTRTIPCKSTVLVASRLPNDALYRELAADPAALEAAGITTLERIGDCFSPGAIQVSTHAGHKFARELDAGPRPEVSYKLERVALEHEISVA